jgi:hypothetical protein
MVFSGRGRHLDPNLERLVSAIKVSNRRRET